MTLRSARLHSPSPGVIIAKQRHGPIGTVRLAFEGAATKFSNRDSPEYLPDEAF